MRIRMQFAMAGAFAASACGPPCDNTRPSSWFWVDNWCLGSNQCTSDGQPACTVTGCELEPGVPLRIPISQFSAALADRHDLLVHVVPVSPPQLSVFLDGVPGVHHPWETPYSSVVRWPEFPAKPQWLEWRCDVVLDDPVTVNTVAFLNYDYEVENPPRICPL